MAHLKAALVGAATSLLCTLLLLSAAYARADERAPQSFDIRPQDLAAALSEFARQSHEEILFAPDIVAEKRSGGVRGTMQPLAALKILLNDSGLPFSSTPSGAILIGQAGASPVFSTAEARDNSQKEGKNNSSKDFRVAQMDQGKSSGATSVGNQASGSQESSKSPSTALSEIIVTAQKRDQRLQDVPVPVSVIDAQSLVQNNQMRIQDYYTSVPGISLTTLGSGGGASLSIRGLTTGGFINPTVGIVVDDIPFGASTVVVSGAAVAAPDIDPSELSRVEVLRGPQGTLYGASSLGGLLKFVTVDPSTSDTSGDIQVGTTGVFRGDELGYKVRGSVNIPLSDTFAVRLSGSKRRDPGYIDNVQTGQEDVNRIDSDSGRLVALWLPSDLFSLKLSALYQDTKRDGSPDVTLGLGDLQQSALINTGTYDQEFQAYTATAKLKLGNAELTSLSGYSISKLSDFVDTTPTFGPATLFLFHVDGTAASEVLKTSKFTQEFRLSMPIASRVEWLLGAFYTHENTPGPGDTLAIAPNGSVVGTDIHNVVSGSYSEYAAFTDFTFKLTDRFDVQVGGRKSYNKITYTGLVGTGALYELFQLPNPYTTPASVTKDNAFTYLVTPQFTISPDLMLYTRLASGYRPGGPNTLTIPAPGVPTEYRHDTTQNYEIGVKGDAVHHAVSFDASVTDPADVFVHYTFNSGAARSEGAELSVELRPLEGLRIAAWGAYNKADLTEVPTNSYLTAQAGDRLPYSARWSGTVSVDQDVRLTSRLTGFFGSSLSYVGDRKGAFFTGVPQGTFPAYLQWDVRGGARLDSWTLNAFVNNLADRRGVLASGNDAYNGYTDRITYIQPRTVGLLLSKSF